MVNFQTEFEKIPIGAWVPGPGLGYFFQTQFGNGPFFQNSLKTEPCFQTFLKIGPLPVFKHVKTYFLKVSLLAKGRKYLTNP